MKTELYLTAAAETDQISKPLILVLDPVLVLDVRVEELDFIGVQHLTLATGKPTPVGRTTQQVALLNFLLQLRLVNPNSLREVFDDVLDVVEELVVGDFDHEQSLLVMLEVLVLQSWVCREISGADETLTVTRHSPFSLNFWLELRFGLNGVVGWGDGV